MEDTPLAFGIDDLVDSLDLDDVLGAKLRSLLESFAEAETGLRRRLRAVHARLRALLEMPDVDAALVVGHAELSRALRGQIHALALARQEDARALLGTERGEALGRLVQLCGGLGNDAKIRTWG